MSQRQTTVAKRNHFIDLKLVGHTLKEVAEETGWSLDCVRFWWRRYRDGGMSTLVHPDTKPAKITARISFRFISPPSYVPLPRKSSTFAF